MRHRRWPKTAEALPKTRPLTRSEVYKIVSRRTGYRQKDVDCILDTFLMTFVDALKNGDTMTFRNIGRFEHMVPFPGLRWDRDAGTYRVKHHGRTFKFLPSTQLAEMLAENLAREMPMEFDELLEKTGVANLDFLIERTQRRVVEGDYVAPDTLPKLQRAREAALEREAADMEKEDEED
jgi:nucleoid DNA-binding protein